VEGLWTACRPQIFFADLARKPVRSHLSGAASHRASLARAAGVVTIRKRVGLLFFVARIVEVNAITFQETIHGRSYVIVVLPVGPGRWRAEVSRTPGATTALMPFYGQTPDEAARQLASWLERAGSRAPRPIGV
jgi:hypothetical protein